MPVDDLEEFRDLDEKVRLREVAANLSRQLADAKNRSAALVDAVSNAAYAAAMVVGVPAPKAPKAEKRSHGTEVALWHMTDWQGAKLTTSYNSQVMRERVQLFAQKAVAITEIQRAHHPVKDATIMLGGDMVEGLFNFPTQPFEVDATIFEQYVTVAMLLVEVVSVALANYENVTVIGEWGNHGQDGVQARRHPAV